MILIEEFRSFIQINTGITTKLARDTLPNMQDETELPVIYCTYATVDSKDPNVPIESSIFKSHGEDLVQTFEVHILDTLDNFRATWVLLFNNLTGKNIDPDEVYYSGFTYAQGGKMGLSNGKIVWVDLWRIGFSTTKPLT